MTRQQPRRQPLTLWAILAAAAMSGSTTTTANAFVLSNHGGHKRRIMPKTLGQVSGSSSIRSKDHRLYASPSDDDDDSASSRKRSKQVIGWSSRRSCSSSTLGCHSASKRARIARLLKFSSRKGTALQSKTNDDDNESNKNKKSSMDSIVVQKWKAAVEAWDQAWDNLFAMLPEPVRALWKSLCEFALGFRLVLMSFAAGCVFATAGILVPIYNQVDTLSQPVTLFETILSDLESGYVDPVDTNKLFETGVAAMLRSLDPYTEYEGPQEAVELNESIDGKYGGVGLVISGSTKPLPDASSGTTTNAKEEQDMTATPNDKAAEEGVDIPNIDGKPVASTSSFQPGMQSSTKGKMIVALDDEDGMDDDSEDADDALVRQQEQRLTARMQQKGIRVVNAFENYAFDYGMRVGDKLVAIDDEPLSPGTTVEGVRNKLRGEPGTLVSISFERDGVQGVQTITMPRSVVRVRDVKLATFLGSPKDGIGYIQLSGFASETGREMRNAIHFLQRVSEDASGGDQSLQGLVLDLRGNPGGLLTSAVDVASLLVPKGSDIVSAKGRGFPGVLYRSRVDPILDSNTKLVVLVNRNTASAAEIVSGAIQDLDVGVVVGTDRTFGKGLVQNVEELPFKSALKFTVAKYYTPSGRCIQGIQYKEGGGLKVEDGKYQEQRIAKKDRSVFYTKNGRVVRDGGGVEADVKVEAPKASALEVTLLRSGVLADFAAEWSKKHELTNNFNVDEDTYRNFQNYVMERQKNGEIELEAIYSNSLAELKKMLKQSGYKGSEREVESLQASIIRDVQRDFEKYRKDIKEDISQSILARYLPESMLIERGIKSDAQVAAAVKLMTAPNRFDKVLAREPASTESNTGMASAGDASLKVASTSTDEDTTVRGKVDF
eukprot:CAMPEP_0172450700 /NCGR_PEP_ID=MMETSP1065-20121228/8946_1 /TAXON_ID=265537 /ORGANISM="Amphiprora paludosa, Strain CCMP125" /LENGTH=888 /DNA_ID=CAMNT_0013202515 /DNA_START=438 /DNA_END=3104 /DNA_ORIENTATION=-